MIGTQQTGIVEALIFGHKAGLNLDQMINILKGGGAGSFWLENFGPKMLKRDFGPGFYVEHFVKDLNIVMEESEKMGLTLPNAKLCKDMWQLMQDEGGARMGTHGLLTVLEKMNGVKVHKYEDSIAQTSSCPSSDEAEETELRTPNRPNMNDVNLGAKPAM